MVIWPHSVKRNVLDIKPFWSHFCKTKTNKKDFHCHQNFNTCNTYRNTESYRMVQYLTYGIKFYKIGEKQQFWLNNLAKCMPGKPVLIFLIWNYSYVNFMCTATKNCTNFCQVLTFI